MGSVALYGFQVAEIFDAVRLFVGVSGYTLLLFLLSFIFIKKIKKM